MGSELNARCEQVTGNCNHSARAIKNGRARGTVIEHEAVVSVIHLQQRRARETLALAVLDESTTCDAQVAVGIGEAHNRFLGNEWVRPELKPLCTGKRHLQFEHCNLFGMGTREMLDACGNRLLVQSVSNLDLLPVLVR